ncbi:alpha/beta-hydrolase [Rhizodiscina lignyota]|uniref:Alpha/beta-hydrolase n=1 Tax=Rhizodiscina lignyota TaxID=1504668 RepID=A0A9P4I9R6_9PEZI|nr:alpha/beta-hydrolase [Rhizodiscina lignyota]
MEKSPSMRTTNRSDRSLYMRILQRVIRPFKEVPGLIKPNKTYPAGSPRLKPPGYARKCNIQERQVEGVYVYDITSASRIHDTKPSADSKAHRIYYFAGGGFQKPPSSQHWRFLTAIAMQLPNAAVSVISPPLAPNCPAPKTFPQLVRVYEILLREAKEQKQRVTFAGDSSGANLALSLTLAALADGAEYSPDAILVISPSVDSAKVNTEMVKIEPHDPILSVAFTRSVAEKWGAEWVDSDPRVSPIHRDLSLFKDRGVKVFAVTGGNDILAPDALLFRDKCIGAGVEGEWLHWEGQMHCFPLAFMYGLRESREAYESIVDRLREIGNGEPR